MLTVQVRSLAPFPDSSMVERFPVKAYVVGSSPARGAMAPSSSFGLGRRIVNPVTWVQIPLGPPH